MTSTIATHPARHACRRRWWACGLAAAAVTGSAWAVQPPRGGSLAEKAFSRSELYVPTANVPREHVASSLSNGSAWEAFLARHGDARAFVDPRSGAMTNVIARIPLLPGRGDGNRVTLDQLSARLGREVKEVDAAVVADLMHGFFEENAAALGLDARQLGPVSATRVTGELWQISAPQQVDGVSVRHARVAATLKHGNLVLLGTETWGDVRIGTAPALDDGAALEAGFAYTGGRRAADLLWKEPQLEIVPVDAAASARADDAAGQGYAHRLVWAFGFVRGGEAERWEVLVDAHTGELLSFQDTNQYATGQVVGGVYPTTSTDVCTLGPSGLIDYEKCGLMQGQYPMPWTDVSQPSGFGFASGHGLYTYNGGTASTTLSGQFVNMNDTCGPTAETSSTGFFDLGGVTGQHDCTVPAGHSAGDTSSARSCFYETNKLIDMARGWTPANPWLSSTLPANVNLNNCCNAFYSFSGSVNFYRSGGGCRNTGELAAVFDHEWGHALDDNDLPGTPGNGNLSNSSEAYADIAAIYRLQTSCVGYGFMGPAYLGCGPNPSCGLTPDGTGRNCQEVQTGAGSYCCTDCSGVRDADWARHSPAFAATPQNFVCPSCLGGSGPCGRQVHCAAAPSRQAAWDYAARDLRAAPFLFDTTTAFILGSKTFFQGSGNIALWHACNCAAGTSDGCGATNAYMQWLAADDDNGNVADGTPHMTALFNAFDRHRIACATPTPTNSGCPVRLPTPVVTVASAPDYVKLSWRAVANAVRYWVFRSEGFTGCHFGKTLIATVPAGPPVLTYADTGLLERRRYCYSVVAVGSSDDCFGRASTCNCVTTGDCGAPVSLLREDFLGGIPATWTVVDGGVGGGTAATWTDADPCGHQPPAPFVAPSPMVDTKCAGTFPPPLVQDEQLISPAVDASNCKRVFLEFSNYYIWDEGGVADVDVSVDGGTSWTNVYRMEASEDYPTPGTKLLDITTPAALEPSVQVRFHYLNNFIWSIDNVKVICGCP